MVGIERLDAMRMTAGDRVRAVIDQPSRQLSLALRHPSDVLFAPMQEKQNERCLPPRVRDRRRDAIAIRALAARVVHGDYRGLRARSRLENEWRRSRADDGNVVRLQTGDRVQESILSEIAGMIVRETDRVDPRRG